jgi:hypothetical protein
VRWLGHRMGSRHSNPIHAGTYSLDEASRMPDSHGQAFGREGISCDKLKRMDSSSPIR